MRHGKTRFVMGFLALPLALYVWYVVWPFAQSIGYSFTDWGGYSDEQHYIGFANYVRLFNDELIRIAFWHNVFFLITVPVITIALALFFAFLLNVGGRGNRAGIRGVWGSGVYKIIFFFPQVLSLVLIAVMWQAIYRGDDQGLLNGLLIKTGLVDKEHPLGFVADPTPFLGVPAVLWWILFIAVWGGVGFYLVLFSAAMQAIPRDIYEAALLDGASRVTS
ncbi:MAG: carbohydrate ABC transporter permease, partial [Streptosporangiaceae bacterium]